MATLGETSVGDRVWRVNHLSLLQSDTLQAQPQATCFVCGSDNPGGLQLRYECGVDGTVQRNVDPDEHSVPSGALLISRLKLFLAFG